jgi:O-antigen/teichoic acid export membrane protein
MIGASAIAFYEVAAKLGSLAFQSTGLAISALPPFVAHKETVTTPEGMTAFFITGSRYLSLLLVPIYVLALILTPAFIQAWVGPEYSISILAAQLLIASALPYPFFILVDSILVARDQFRIWVPYAIAVALINLLFTVALISRFGFLGAAAGTFVACMCEVGCYLWVLHSKIHCSLRTWFLRVFAPTCAMALINGVLSFFLIYMLKASGFVQLVGCFTLVALFGYGIIFLAVFSKEERVRCTRFLRSIADSWYRPNQK